MPGRRSDPGRDKASYLGRRRNECGTLKSCPVCGIGLTGRRVNGDVQPHITCRRLHMGVTLGHQSGNGCEEGGLIRVAFSASEDIVARFSGSARLRRRQLELIVDPGTAGWGPGQVDCSEVTALKRRLEFENTSGLTMLSMIRLQNNSSD